MFTHAGFRPLWPAIFLVPWILLGVGYLYEAVLQRRLREASVRKSARAQLRRHPGRWGTTVVILGLLTLAASRVTHADPPTHEPPACEAPDAREARSLADALYERGEYQHAAVCYDAAGDPLRAHRAFLKAVGPGAEVTAHGLKQESATAKTLLNQVQQAFTNNH